MHFDAKTSEYFLELLRSALHNRPAQPKPQDVSWSDLFEFAKSQSLSYMAYCAIRKSGFDIGDELKQQWAARCSMNLVKYCNQEHECERICAALSAAGIRNMPLKGSVICHFYPEPHMREMSDLDILVRNEDMERAQAIMLQQGYSFILKTTHNRDFQKLPYMIVEMHNYLIPQDSSMFTYYKSFWKKYYHNTGSLTCNMSWDDFYIYMFAHAYKHFYHHGTGIRSVIDVYVAKSKLKDELHRDYIIKEMKKLGILNFAVNFEQLADCMFAEETQPIPEDLQSYKERVLSSGTYGSDTYMKSTALRYMQEGKSFRAAKLMTLIKMLFPALHDMKTKYPVLKYVPFLLPLFWVIRWISDLIRKPKSVSAFFMMLKKLPPIGDKKERR